MEYIAWRYYKSTHKLVQYLLHLTDSRLIPCDCVYQIKSRYFKLMKQSIRKNFFYFLIFLFEPINTFVTFLLHKRQTGKSYLFSLFSLFTKLKTFVEQKLWNSWREKSAKIICEEGGGPPTATVLWRRTLRQQFCVSCMKCSYVRATRAISVSCHLVVLTSIQQRSCQYFWNTRQTPVTAYKMNNRLRHYENVFIVNSSVKQLNNSHRVRSKEY